MILRVGRLRPPLWIVTLLLVSAFPPACSRRKLPAAIKPYWSGVLKLADTLTERCHQIMKSPGGCPERIDDAPAIPLGELASAPAFYAAIASCERDEPFFLCGFRDAGGPLTPGVCLGKFRRAGEGWSTNAFEPGEAVAVTDDPACGLIQASIVRRIPSGGTMKLAIEFKGKPD
jgi:hypothetical protein